MAKPSFRRRKEDRPAEITEAAMAAFAEKGYDATRVDDVARRAGVSKGLLYLYFKTKEDLFKAVIKSFVSPRVAELETLVRTTDLSAEEFLRGPFLEFIRRIPLSPVRVLVRLMIAEGPKHPDLTLYYWENVISHGLGALREIVRKGVDSGEFRPSALEEFPHLLVAPVLFSTVWTGLFQRYEEIDVDRLLEAHVELVLAAIGRSSAVEAFR